MSTKRILAIRKKSKKGHYDRPEIVAPGAYDLAKKLIGRKHAQETQLRWLMMDLEDLQKEQYWAREAAKHRETASAFGRQRTGRKKGIGMNRQLLRATLVASFCWSMTGAFAGCDRDEAKQVGDKVQNEADKAGDAVNRGLDKAGDATHHALDRAGEATNRGINSANDASRRAAEEARDAANTARDAVGRAAQKSGEAVEQAGQKVKDWVSPTPTRAPATVPSVDRE